jgi:hypothetical protein
VAQIIVPTGSEKLYVGQESTYGTAATTAFAAHVQGSAKAKLSQTEIENAGASARLFQRFTTVQGLKSTDSGVSFSIYGKPASALLTTGASPSTPYLGTLLKAILGDEYAAAGSTAAGTPSTTSVDVQAGHGTRFRVGTVVAIEVSSVYYHRVVTGIATDTLTVWPALPSAPSAGDDVVNSYNYFLTESNTKSLTVEHTHTVSATDSATVQRRLLGCTGNVSFSVARDSLAQFGFDLKAADWSYGSLSLGVTVGSETMGSPIPVTAGVVYLQAAGTTTDTQYCVASLSSSLSSGMTHLPCLGGVQGTSGVARMGGRDSGEFTLRFKADVARYTEWSAQTLLRMLAVFPSGSGTSKRANSLYCNQAQIVGVPQEVEEGGFLYYEVKLRPVLDTAQTVDTAAGSPYVLALS